MPKEGPVVHWENTILCYGPSPRFEVGLLVLWLSGTGNRLQSRSRNWFHGFAILRSTGRCSTLRARCARSTPQARYLLCHGRKRCSKRGSGFDSGASTTASSDLEGVNAVRFGIPKRNGFDMTLEAVALRSFRRNFFGGQCGEQDVVFAPSFVLRWA